MGAWDCSDRCTPGEYVATYSVRQKYASVHTPTVACVLHSMRVGVTRAAAHPVASLPGACARGDRIPLRGTGPLAPLRNYKKEKNINVTTQKPNGTACTHGKDASRARSLTHLDSRHLPDCTLTLKVKLHLRVREALGRLTYMMMTRQTSERLAWQSYTAGILRAVRG